MTKLGIVREETKDLNDNILILDITRILVELQENLLTICYLIILKTK